MYETPKKIQLLVDAAMKLGFHGSKKVTFFDDKSWQAVVCVEFPPFTLIDIDNLEPIEDEYRGIGLRITLDNLRDYPTGFLAYIGDMPGYESDWHPHCGSRDNFCTAGGAVEAINMWLEKGYYEVAYQEAFATARQYNPGDSYRRPPSAAINCHCGQGYGDWRGSCSQCNVELCEECDGYCRECEESMCPDCRSYCEDCYETLCRYCQHYCESCHAVVCEAHTSGACDNCSRNLCVGCNDNGDSCAECGWFFCQSCVEGDGGSRTLYSCDECSESLCSACAIYTDDDVLCKSCLEYRQEREEQEE